MSFGGTRPKDLPATKKVSLPTNKKEERPNISAQNSDTNGTTNAPPQPQPAPPKKEIKTWSDLFAKEKAASQAAEEKAQTLKILAAITLKGNFLRGV